MRKSKAKGFAKCDTCERLEAIIAAAQTNEQIEKFQGELRMHHESVKQDRIEMARIARLCKRDLRHVGFMIDAVDKFKFQLPTTERSSKSMQKLTRVVQKLTGVQYFDDDSVHLFSTLPDVPTGGNLTMTIIADIFKTKRVQQATDLYINFDGASDNICYHVFYGLAFLLHCAHKAGWPLQCIHILRFKVFIMWTLTYTHSRMYSIHKHVCYYLYILLVCRWGTRTIN